MTTLVVIIVVIVVLVAAVLVYASTKPSVFRVERTTSINAPREKIYPLINDFRNWVLWSPYEKLDSTMKKTYGGAPSGKGATYAWIGNNKVGTGRMEITDTSAPARITIKLDFEKPFEGHNIAEFTLEPAGTATTVTWAVHGPSPLLSKLMQVFVDMDTLLGKDFAAGLANLKAAAEK